MSRSNQRRGDKELDDLQRLKKENKKLKQDITALRKQLQRIDFRRFENLSQLVDKQHRESLEEIKATKLEAAKKHWICHKCGKDYLRLVIWDHPVKGPCYYRKCGYPQCQHRTEMKVVTNPIEGVTESGEFKEVKNETDSRNKGNS